MGAPVERRGQALLSLTELLPSRLYRRLPLVHLLERGVHSRSDLGDTGHSFGLLYVCSLAVPDYRPVPAALSSTARNWQTAEIKAHNQSDYRF
ncbi:hypothetical protein Apa02nite_076260 [Actinoplanes palleronii]|uniref:Uncharacterized protein n=1 Tax=Actinoplanes palleronii TaxID=113570 RepID=A0ABQ4BLI5_9ACTN|nr:hypothetical protein Apa02nite_076260 [Actinoplanes palleronii]